MNGGINMFTQRELDFIDTNYFRIIQLSGYSITLQSKNTQHCWHILSQCYGNISTCQIHHTHHKYTPYHLHGHAPCISAAIHLIKKHDEYQLHKISCKKKSLPCYNKNNKTRNTYKF